MARTGYPRAASAHGRGIQVDEPEDVGKPAQVERSLDERKRRRHLDDSRADEGEERDEERRIPRLPLVDSEDEEQRESDATRDGPALEPEREREQDAASRERRSLRRVHAVAQHKRIGRDVRDLVELRDER